MAASRSPRPVLEPATALALLDDLFGQQTAALGLLDRELRYIAVNDALAAMNGLPAADHIGRTIAEVIPEAGVAPLVALTRRVFAGEQVEEIDVALPDVENRRFKLSALPVREQGEVVAMLAIVVEHTDAARAEAALRLSEERLRLALEGTHTGTFEWEADTDTIRWSPSMGPLWGHPRGWMPDGYGGFEETVHPDDRAGLRETIDAALRAERGYETEYRIRLPEGPERWINTRVHVITDDGALGRSTLVGLAADVTARRQRERGLELVSRASLALAESLDPTSTLRHVADLTVPELADWCAVHLVGDNGAIEQIAVAHADPEKVRWALELQQRYPPDPDAPTGVPEVVRTGKSELYPVIPSELLEASAQDAEHLRIIRELRLHSAMVVPLVARGRTIGAITFVFADSKREYTAGLLELAEELGRRAGIAVDNARLHAAERHANARLRELQAVTDLGLAHLELDELLHELLQRVVALLHGDIAAVLLLDETDEHLRTRASVGLEEELTSGTRIPLGQGIAGRIAGSREPLIVDDVPAARPISRHLREQVASLVGVPLLDGDRVLGVLHVSTRVRRVFTESDVELLELVADRAARAISHARLFEQATSVAVTLQRSLLPRALPAIGDFELAVRYLPGQAGTEVGGDWYDAFELDAGCWALVVGDVVGRGLIAASTMGQLRSALRAYAVEHSDPARTLEKLDVLALSLEEVPFATIAMLSISPRDGEGHLSLAGHPAPVIRAADGAVRPLPFPAGPPLGTGAPPRAAQPIVLGAGETLVLFTDGLVERRDRSLVERQADLDDAIATGPRDVEALADHLLERMLGGSTGDDDVALVVLHRPETP